MELTRQRILTIVLAVMVVVSFGLYLFLYHPLLLKLKAKFLEYRAVESEVATARSNIAIFKTSPQGKKLVAPEEVSVAMDELTRQGKAKRIKFRSITPQKVEQSGNAYEILPIEIETESDYESLGLFLGCLDDLEKSLVILRSFDLSAKEKDVSKIRARLVLHMHLRN